MDLFLGRLAAHFVALSTTRLAGVVRNPSLTPGSFNSTTATPRALNKPANVVLGNATGITRSQIVHRSFKLMDCWTLLFDPINFGG